MSWVRSSPCPVTRGPLECCCDRIKTLCESDHPTRPPLTAGLAKHAAIKRSLKPQFNYGVQRLLKVDSVSARELLESRHRRHHGETHAGRRAKGRELFVAVSNQVFAAPQFCRFGSRGYLPGAGDARLLRGEQPYFHHRGHSCTRTPQAVGTTGQPGHVLAFHH
jgi:hypothetical protein